ncbi:MAG TPA: flagellar hook-length control protein FliK [Chloroflexota bacterium]|nr:flagellar hook-length control protein FliK [Chloroflexota bacterium]
MHSFLGIAPATAPRGASSASDVSPSDARSASAPKDGEAFRTALDNANQRSSDSGRAERTSSRPASTTALDSAPTENDASLDESEATTDSEIPADAMAMLLNWLVPTTQTPTAPLTAGLTGSADASATTAPIGMAAEGALVASFGVLTALPNGSATSPIAQDALLADTSTSAGQADPALASTIPSTADGVDLTGMTATTDGPALATTAPTTTTAADTLDPDLLAAMQATTDARAASAAAQSANAAGSATSAQATGTAVPMDLASLAAAVYPDAGGGAQIVATTGSTTRSAGPVASAHGQAPLVAAAEIQAAGSAAQAAGASATASVQLPGQAVTAAGAASQDTAGTLAEALEAGPEAVSAPQASTQAPTELQTALNALSTNGVGQAQDVDTGQVGSATTPPIASQIADGALMAARRIGQSVEMILQPEGLGSVSLRVSVERAGLAVHMAVDNPQAREMVQASWPQLQQALEQRGLTVQSLLLDLANGRGNGDGFQEFQQFNGNQQFTGQQARGGSNNGDRRGNLAVSTVDEGTPTQADAGTASRVDYRI